jgi:hypothetical protein
VSIPPQRQPATRVHPISGSKYPVPRGADRTKIETFLLPQSEHSNALLANHRKTARPLLDQMCLAKDNKTDPSHTHSLSLSLSPFYSSTLTLFGHSVPNCIAKERLALFTFNQDAWSTASLDSLFFGIDCNIS